MYPLKLLILFLIYGILLIVIFKLDKKDLNLKKYCAQLEERNINLRHASSKMRAFDSEGSNQNHTFEECRIEVFYKKNDEYIRLGAYVDYDIGFIDGKNVRIRLK